MKRKKIEKILIALAFTGLLTSCKMQVKNEKQETAHVVSADSLIQQWNAAWNNQDQPAIAGMFDSQSIVVFSVKEKIYGADSIMKNWIGNNLPRVRNLKTEKISDGSAPGMTYYSGNYSLDIVSNDSIVGQDLGCFTSIWVKKDDNSWKIQQMIFTGPGE